MSEPSAYNLLAAVFPDRDAAFWGDLAGDLGSAAEHYAEHYGCTPREALEHFAYLCGFMWGGDDELVLA